VISKRDLPRFMYLNVDNIPRAPWCPVVAAIGTSSRAPCTPRARGTPLSVPLAPACGARLSERRLGRLRERAQMAQAPHAVTAARPDRFSPRRLASCLRRNCGPTGGDARATRRREDRPGGSRRRFAAVSGAARVADHYHSASEHGIIGRRIDTVVAVGAALADAGLVRPARGGRRSRPEGAARAPRGEDHWYVCA
jgi:hypothetical protein